MITFENFFFIYFKALAISIETILPNILEYYFKITFSHYRLFIDSPESRLLLQEISMDEPSTSRSTSKPIEGEYLWTILEKKVTIPKYIKKIFEINHLDNLLAFKNITSEILNELETFARGIMKVLLKDSDDLETYYGIYQKMPESFSFLPGDRLLIYELVEFVKNKSEDFWLMYSEKTGKIDTNIDNDKISDNSVKVNILVPNQTHNVYSKIDTEDEKKSLMRMLQFFLQKEENKSDFDKDNYEMLLKAIDINVFVQEVYEGKNTPQAYTYTAKIKCPICSYENKITKVHGVKGKSDRWVISNIKRHIQTHKNTAKKANKKKSTYGAISKFTVTKKPSDTIAKNTNVLFDLTNTVINIDQNTHSDQNLDTCESQNSTVSYSEEFDKISEPVVDHHVSVINRENESLLTEIATSKLVAESLDVLNEYSGE